MAMPGPLTCAIYSASRVSWWTSTALPTRVPARLVRQHARRRPIKLLPDPCRKVFPKRPTTLSATSCLKRHPLEAYSGDYPPDETATTPADPTAAPAAPAEAPVESTQPVADSAGPQKHSKAHLKSLNRSSPQLPASTRTTRSTEYPLGGTPAERSTLVERSGTSKRVCEVRIPERVHEVRMQLSAHSRSES
jgi:hypothetical protein